MNLDFPYWSELPDLDLYLDQVLAYVNQVTRSAIGPQDKGLTAAMVNNYVKQGHLDKPVKKKYGRRQLARLIVIVSLKNVFAIQDLAQALSVLTAEGQSQTRYDDFVRCMRGEVAPDCPEVVLAACQTLHRYQQTLTLVAQLESKGDADENR